MRDDALVRFTAHQLPREALHDLMARSNGPALLRTLWHFGVLAITGTLLWKLRSTAWVLPLLLVHGYALALTFCPYRNYRVYHWEHHRFTQDRERDPELYFSKPESLPAYVFVLTGIPNLVRRVGDILRLAIGRADRPWMAPSERRPLIIEARAYLAVYVAVAAASMLAGSPIALLVWIVPWMLGQAFLRPYLLAEHTACSFTRDCLENTRTTLTLPLVRLFAWNMPYHAEHHAYPAVPFHALPRLHERVQGKIENLEPGYVAASVKVARYLFGQKAASLHRAVGSHLPDHRVGDGEPPLQGARRQAPAVAGGVVDRVEGRAERDLQAPP